MSGWVQVQPASTVQIDEQPSPSAVLPSSHSSPSTMPSPQVEVHAPPVQFGSF
jgi:hypothetical protein